jgi:hypothetical protein
MSLDSELVDWTDVDLAQYSLGSSIGLFPQRTFLQAKSVFWTNNAVGDALWKMLHALTDAGVLEYRQEPDHQFRWSQPGPDVLRRGKTSALDVRQQLRSSPWPAAAPFRGLLGSSPLL